MHTDTCLTHGPHNTQTLIIHIFQCKQSSECILVHRCQGILPTTALSCTAPLTVREGAVPVDGVPPEDEAARAAATSASRRPLCCFALAAARSASPSAADTCMKPGGTHGAHGVAHAGPSVALRSLPPARPRPMQPTPAWRGGHMGRNTRAPLLSGPFAAHSASPNGCSLHRKGGGGTWGGTCSVGSTCSTSVRVVWPALSGTARPLA